MNGNRFKLSAVLAAAVFGLMLWAHPNGQAEDKGNPSRLGTNWVGCIVVGKVETGDLIAGRKPFPQPDSEIELGLRSDGMVVWRKAPK